MDDHVSQDECTWFSRRLTGKKQTERCSLWANTHSDSSKQMCVCLELQTWIGLIVLVAALPSVLPLPLPGEDSPGCTLKKIAISNLLTAGRNAFQFSHCYPGCQTSFTRFPSNLLCELIGCNTFLFQRHRIGNNVEKFYQVRHGVWSRKQASGAVGSHRKNITNNVSPVWIIMFTVFTTVFYNLLQWLQPADVLLVSVWLESQ